MSVALSQIWADLGADERLAIVLERSTADLRRMLDKPGLHPLARARLAGYANALGDMHFYVVEGNPLPGVEDL